MCEKPSPLAVYYDFGFRTLFKIKIPRRMHIVAAKRPNNNQIGSVLKIENRCCSLSTCFAAPRNQHHERRSSEQIA